MRKVIGAINMTLDGFCDHTAITPDDKMIEHYNNLLLNAGDILYGRITHQLMEDYWPNLVKNPSGNKADDDFAAIIENIQKTVFSRTLKSVGWKNVRLATQGIKEEVQQLKQQPGNYILAGSRSIIMALLNLDLLDELQICVHPVIATKGSLLFNNMSGRIDLKLVKSEIISKSGAMVLCYERDSLKHKL